jgi:hypothetical protein
MTTNDFWRYLSILFQQSPWLLNFLCVVLLALPLTLVLIAKIPLFVRITKRHRWLGNAGLLFSTAFIQVYYWTVGVAATLMIMLMLLVMARTAFG